jgi:cobalt-zinc-cadmium efflux system membrane fusion protein
MALILALAGCSRPAMQSSTAGSTTATNVVLTPDQRARIQLETVRTAQFHKTIEASGAVDFDNDQSTSVLAPFGGPVTRVLVTLGDQVKAGDALAEVDSPDFATAISTYQKALATAQTLRKLADLDKDLIQHHGVALKEEEQAQTDAANAEADRDAALQGLVALNLDPQIIRDLQAGKPILHAAGIIRSPIAGTVVEKLIAPGQLLTADTTACFTVANLSRMWILAQVFGSEVTTVQVGDSVEVQTGAGINTLAGTVDNISALVDPDTRSVVVRVVVDNPGDILKKQMYVRVRIQAREESSGLLVPVSAILRDDENLPFVYVAQADGSFARRPVALGYRTGDHYEIPAGLNAGDQVVANGGLFLQFMQDQ